MAPSTAAKLTYEDYILIPNDGKRHEIIDGEHYVSPSPNRKHQTILLNLGVLLQPFIRKHGLGELYIAAFDVLLSRNDVFQPDLVFISEARLHLLTPANLQGSPDLAVEILSKSTAKIDQTLKFRQYDRFGVAEYWIVDGDAELVKIHRRVVDVLQLVETVNRDGAVTSPLFPGLTLDAKEIFSA